MVAAIGLAAAAIAAACDRGQRFPVCQSNSDCTARKGGEEAPICYNLRCVACQYDTDCKAGEACTKGNNCEKLSAPAPAVVDGGAASWEPSTWTECAGACKDATCVKKCSERFKQ